MKLYFIALTLSVLALTVAPAALRATETVSLSGEWEFRTDPGDVGKDQKWFEPPTPFDMKIRVPGAWNTQGIGEQTKAMFSGYSGVAWYHRHIELPAAWRGQRVRLWFDRVHRDAEVWVNGQYAGKHLGYVSAFNFDITPYAYKTWTADVVVRVDSRRNPAVDPLYGCMDIMDLPGVEWGGICGNVWIEQTKSAWIESVFVRPHVSTGVAEVVVETGSRTLYGSPERPPDFRVEAEVYDATGKPVGSGKTQMVPGLEPTYTMVGVDKPKLWSPKSPYLYTVKVRLYFEQTLLDTAIDRFGMREIATDGSRFLLNGKPIFYRGFGDDCVFPNTIAPPADKSVYLARLKTAKDYGFNYIRCHSWIPPKEYFDAADEVGIMVQPELPIACAPFYSAGTPELQQFYRDAWRDMIKANRNHPSIVTWSMSNEMWVGFDLAQSLYMAAIDADPTRLVIDSNGVLPPNPGKRMRPTLDFYAVQFDEAGKMGYHDSKYELKDWKPEKPVVIHEMGNFGTFPSFSQEKLFSGGIRPYWLIDWRELAAKKGVSALLPKWQANSDKLQAVALKTNIEAARLSPGISGYDQWLLQDYWAGSNGVLDTFFRTKGLSPSQFRRFNSPTVLLMDTSRRSYRLGETATIKLLVSRYEDPSSANAKLTWKLLDGAKVLTQGHKTGLKIRSNGLQPLATIAPKLPTSGPARKLMLSVQLMDSSGTVTNEWGLWVFPATRAHATSLCIAGCEEVRRLYPNARTVDVGAIPGKCDLLVTSQLTPETIAYLSDGGKVLLIGTEHALPSAPSSYKPYWWLGGLDDSNAGTFVNLSHPAMIHMPGEDWCDLEWYDLLTGSRVVLLDDLPGDIEPIVRCIDVPSAQRNKAYIFEARVGKGKLLVASMNFKGALRSGDPCASYMLDQLIGYSLGPKFAPAASLPLDSLAARRGENSR